MKGKDLKQWMKLNGTQELADWLRLAKEIASALGIPEGTVMSRLFHARRRLREQLAPHLEGGVGRETALERAITQPRR